MKNKVVIALLFVASLFFYSARAFSAASDAESLHAEALASYHDQAYVEALNKIDAALEIIPRDIALRELKALTLKALGNASAAYQVYNQLSEEWRNSPQKRAPYEFELGMLEYEKRNLTAAEPHFLYSINQQFNPEVAKFLLGALYFDKKSWVKAQSYLEEVLHTPLTEIRGQSNLYLGQLFIEQASYNKAIRHLIAAREVGSELSVASDARQVALGNQIIQATDSLVGNFNKSSVTGQIGMITGYDSNVLLNPTSNADPASQRASLKETLFFSLGYTSSPTKPTQLQALYQGSGNYNFNEVTRPGQFVINDLSGSWIFGPQNDTRFGVRFGAQHILRYGADGSSTAGRFGNYAFTGTVGPFLKSESSNGVVLGAELLFQPQNYFQDSDSPEDYRKSGYGGIARFTRQGNSTFLGLRNPTLAATFDLRQTKGTEFRSKAVGIDYTGSWLLSQRFSVAPVAGMSYTAYQVRTDGYRGDWFLNGQLNSQFRFTRNLSLTAALQVAKNFSSVVETYEYFRYAMSTGLNYIF